MPKLAASRIGRNISTKALQKSCCYAAPPAAVPSSLTPGCRLRREPDEETDSKGIEQACPTPPWLASPAC